MLQEVMHCHNVDGSTSPLMICQDTADATGKHALGQLQGVLALLKAHMHSTALGIGAICVGAVALATSRGDSALPISATYCGTALALATLAAGVQFLSSRALQLLWSSFLVIAPSCWSVGVMLMSQAQVERTVRTEPERRQFVQLAYLAGGAVQATFPRTSRHWKRRGLACVVAALLLAGFLIYMRTGLVAFAMQVAVLNNILPCCVGYVLAGLGEHAVRRTFRTAAALQAQLSATSAQLSDASAQLRAVSARVSSAGGQGDEGHIQPNEVRLRQAIGQGGMGVVYTGEWLGTLVAVKVLQNRAAPHSGKGSAAPRASAARASPHGGGGGGKDAKPRVAVHDVGAMVLEARTLARVSRHPCVWYAHALRLQIASSTYK